MATQNDSAHISYIDQYNKTTTIATKKYINKVIALFEKQVQCPFQDLTPSQVEQCLEQFLFCYCKRNKFREIPFLDLLYELHASVS